MSEREVRGARQALPLSPRSTAAIRADLAERPEALLHETLRAILEAGRWVEQEALLGS